MGGLILCRGSLKRRPIDYSSLAISYFHGIVKSQKLQVQVNFRLFIINISQMSHHILYTNCPITTEYLQHNGSRGLHWSTRGRGTGTLDGRLIFTKLHCFLIQFHPFKQHHFLGQVFFSTAVKVYVFIRILYVYFHVN